MNNLDTFTLNLLVALVKGLGCFASPTQFPVLFGPPRKSYAKPVLEERFLGEMS
jgi:hypothetical protein